MPHLVTTLAIYPVKGMRALYPQEARVERLGLEHDRRWAVIGADGRVLTQREHARLACVYAHSVPGGLHLSAAGHGTVEAMPGGGAVTLNIWGTQVAAVTANEAASAWLSEVLRVACTLVHQADPASRAVTPALARPGDTVSLADGFPLLLAGTASLAAVNAALPAALGAVPMDRFRPNLVVETAVAWEEDGWSHVELGGVRLRLVSRCVRCTVVTLDQETGAATPRNEPLRTLGLIHRDAEGRITFGWNAVPETLGVIRVGDTVTPILRTCSKPILRA